MSAGPAMATIRLRRDAANALPQSANAKRLRRTAHTPLCNDLRARAARRVVFQISRPSTDFRHERAR